MKPIALLFLSAVCAVAQPTEPFVNPISKRIDEITARLDRLEAKVFPNGVWLTNAVIGPYPPRQFYPNGYCLTNHYTLEATNITATNITVSFNSPIWIRSMSNSITTATNWSALLFRLDASKRFEEVTIPELLKSGAVCRAIGHHWEFSDTDSEKDGFIHKCRICYNCNTRQVLTEEWK